MHADELICICKQATILAIRINVHDMHRCSNMSVRAIFLIHGTLMQEAVLMLFSCPRGEKAYYITV